MRLTRTVGAMVVTASLAAGAIALGATANAGSAPAIERARSPGGDASGGAVYPADQPGWDEQATNG